MIQSADDYKGKAINSGYSTIKLPGGRVIDIEHDYLVKLRSRSDFVPAVPRRLRPARIAKRTLYNLRKVGEKVGS